jgi:hypothetical protein
LTPQAWLIVLAVASLAVMVVNATLPACQTRYMRRADQRAERQP